MRFKNVLALLLLIAVTACSTKEKQTIISGDVKNGAKEISLTKLNSDNIFEDETFQTKIDSNGHFELKLNLDKPTYFYMNGMDVYLCPGDELKITTGDHRQIVYSGTAANACNYLKSTPMYKAGSFLKGGIAFDRKEVNADNLIEFVDSCLLERTQNLNKIEGLDDYFLAIETNRNSLNAANTIMSFGFYEGMRSKWDRTRTIERVKETIKKHHSEIATYLECVNQPKNIILGVCTDLLTSCKENGFYTKYCPELEEYLVVSDFLNGLESEGISDWVLQKRKEVMALVKNKNYSKVIDKVWGNYAALVPGGIAPDLKIELPNGDKKKLSDFKGKLLVVDVWATWCGPCRKEKPIFGQLAKDYKNKPVVFLALSTDANVKAWKKMLDTHKEEVYYENARAESVEGYNIKFIPRFIVIDKDFKVVNAFAPSPSSGMLEKIISENLL